MYITEYQITKFQKTCLFLGPYYLIVSSSGPAAERQSSKMGVFRQTGETHNNKPVWAMDKGRNITTVRSHGSGPWGESESVSDGIQKLFYFYSNGTFIL